MQVAEAVRILADAQVAFSNCHQPAGALEALSWALAAKPAAEITTAQHQVTDGAPAPDVLRVLDQAKQAVELLQALANVANSGHGAPTAVSHGTCASLHLRVLELQCKVQ